jgi:hypothetical protein
LKSFDDACFALYNKQENRAKKYPLLAGRLPSFGYLVYFPKSPVLLRFLSRRGDRVDDGDGLENRFSAS